MRRVHRALVAAVVYGTGAMAAAQTAAPQFPPSLNTEQNPLRNVSAGALAARSPGNMVSAGVARTLAAANFARGVIEIDEPLPGPDPKAVFLADAVEILFEELNTAFLLFENALRIRAGLPPRVPLDFNLPGADTGAVQNAIDQALGNAAAKVED